MLSLPVFCFIVVFFFFFFADFCFSFFLQMSRSDTQSVRLWIQELIWNYRKCTYSTSFQEHFRAGVTLPEAFISNLPFTFFCCMLRRKHTLMLKTVHAGGGKTVFRQIPDASSEISSDEQQSVAHPSPPQKRQKFVIFTPGVLVKSGKLCFIHSAVEVSFSLSSQVSYLIVVSFLFFFLKLFFKCFQGF